MIIRSLLFNLVFYLVLCGYMLAALPTLLMPRNRLIRLAQSWGRTNLRLLRAICNIRVDFRGLEKIPPGPCIVAAKHQSTWETFALLTLFDDPTFILKRELMWIPVFGWYTRKGAMIPVDRGARGQALASMTTHARLALAQGRQIIIFPEGTRRPAGAEPAYKFGVAHLAVETGTPCVPVALNSGLFWPRRALRRPAGTVLVEILDPILPGADKGEFLARLRTAIEEATGRLVAQGERELGGDLARSAARPSAAE